ncbi:transmembrane protein 184a [Thecamonas trahens ATCC 50062]|uniref:Transmembrane protein 184a n=1 Tax=Thecamonas trahens ATCC 50062 TaxID=461836 RepID=A0A0L0DSC2_THETB|nr:transmembrane protein 184a [Thecamonas trahens ATCC 50062]KNC55239.1 transmembrane protein 184a [Thecamonas trahens ATCC 50062]|eukprot:XP_013753168.1 transmembrane protein 184a [Thecamonas trahens ATCC 50062]
MVSVESFAGSSTAVGIAVCAAALGIVVSLVHSFLHLHHYTHKALQRYSVRILLIVPVFALGSLLSLLYPNYALYFATVRDLYEAWVLYCFLHLMIGYGGGDSAIVLAMRVSPGEMRHPWPLCWLKPINVGSSTFLRACKQGVIQFVIVKPVCAALSLAMLVLGYYESTAYQAGLLVVYNISFTYALYELYLFYLGTRLHLAPHHPIRKFVAVKSVVFLTYWQSLAVALLPVPKEDAEAWDNFILCVEMLLFAFVHWFAFSYTEFRDGGASAGSDRGNGDGSAAGLGAGAGSGGYSELDDEEALVVAEELGTLCRCCRCICCCAPDYGQRLGSAFLDVFCIGDVIADTYHSFSPSYGEYMLQAQEVHTRFISVVVAHSSASSSGDVARLTPVGSGVITPPAAPSGSTSASAADSIASRSKSGSGSGSGSGSDSGIV